MERFSSLFYKTFLKIADSNTDVVKSVRPVVLSAELCIQVEWFDLIRAEGNLWIFAQSWGLYDESF